MAALVVVGLLVWVVNPHEPAYQGKTLSEWLYYSYGTGPKAAAEADEAIRSMGKVALPHLIKRLDEHDYWPAKRLSKLLSLREPETAISRKSKALVALAKLGPLAKPAMGRVERILKEEPGLARNAATALVESGPEGQSTVRAYLRYRDQRVKVACAAVLAGIESEQDAVWPILVGGTTYPVSDVRKDAAFGLTRIHSRFDAVKPMLISLLGDSDPTVRNYAAQLLSTFGVERTGH